jgi:hypothetical protein
MAAILSPLSIYGDSQKTKLPLLHKTRIHTPEGHFGNSRRSTIGRMPGDRTSHTLDASLAIPMRVPRFEVSRRARIPFPPAESPVLVFWFNQVTRQFSGEPPQTPHADSCCEPLPCTSTDRWLRLAFLATMRPALDPAGHRVPRVRPTCLSTPWRPRKARPFAPTLHMHQRKLSRNLHLQHSAKSQSKPCCQSLIVARSDHPPVLGRSGPQKSCNNFGRVSGQSMLF